MQILRSGRSLEFPDVHWLNRWIREIEGRVNPMDKVIEHAKKLGTFDAADRSKQYLRADPSELLRAVNEAWTKIRTCEKSIREKEQAIEDLKKQLRNYRIANTALISVITGLAWEGLKALFSLLK